MVNQKSATLVLNSKCAKMNYTSCRHSLLFMFLYCQVKSTHDFEHSEMLLYQNMILRESNKKSEARKHLIEYSKFVTDKLQVKELQGM